MGARLHLGCGDKILPSPWVNVDGCADPVMGGSSGRPDVVLHIPDGLWQLEPAAYEQVYWGHGPEHIFPDKLREALHDLHRILVPGGRLTLATISLEGIFHNAFEQGYSREAVNAYLYGDAKSTDHPLQAHRQVFTEAWLTESLKAAGFAIVRPWALAEYPELQSLGDCASSSYHVTLYLEGIKAP